MQMRTAAGKGTLDGFILEYQSYVNDSNLKNNYQFIPYGFRHDNPLVMIEGSKNEAILKAFADFCQSEQAQKKATEYGFNGNEKYKSDYKAVDGNTLLSAQNLYKENKDNGKEIIAVFVADVSGSMDGAPLNSLKESLINSMKYINTKNHIGLVSYSGNVTVELPINQFDLNQQAYFKGAVEGLSANGTTATYDAILVGSSMIKDAMKDHPDAKPMLFVLSDGETNEGYDYKNIKGIMESLGYPIYTIGYNYSNGSLEELSEINEAASINAETEDIIYQLKQLFNASM
jgi:Ca-activated chloride channel family protein